MSVRILLDECLPRKLKYRIEELDSDFSVDTVPEMGWASMSDGKLLKEAGNEFDVFITSDRNLSLQLSIDSYDIYVLLLKAPTNIYEDLLPCLSKLGPAIKNHKPGKFRDVRVKD